MIEKLKEAIPGVSFHGDSANLDKSLYTVLNVSLPDRRKRNVAFNLDLQGYRLRGGSACSAGQYGIPCSRRAISQSKRGAVRFSFSKYNKAEEIDFVGGDVAALYGIPTLLSVIPGLRRHYRIHPGNY